MVVDEILRLYPSVRLLARKDDETGGALVATDAGEDDSFGTTEVPFEVLPCGRPE